MATGSMPIFLKIARSISLAVLCLSPLGGCHPRSAPSFPAGQAYDYLLRQCALGPRCPGSVGHERMKVFLREELRSCAERVEEQPFLHSAENGRDTLRLLNFVARFSPENKRRILLCAHWDTRPWADQDLTVENRRTPILGANDGGSGVAVLLAVAKTLKQNPPPVGVDIVFFDGEDYGTETRPDDYLLGSKFYARTLAQPYPRLAILLDMVGDRDLQLYQERNSLLFAPKETKEIWKQAAEAGHTEFRPQAKYTVTDDHLPLMARGIPSVDVIDFDYPYWHTLEDTPDKCSRHSLQVVGDVVLRMIYR